MARFVLLRQMVTIEDTLPIGGKPLIRKGMVVSIVRNPLAGVYVTQIGGLTDDLVPVGMAMTRRLLDGLDTTGERIEAFGKAAIVGASGTLDHAALWHGPGGEGLRQFIGDPRALIPFTKKTGSPGQRVEIALGTVGAHAIKHASDKMELVLTDAPRADELVLVIAASAHLPPEVAETLSP